jgi:hypothetical protein
MKLRIFVCFIYVIGAGFIHAVSGAQPGAPAPRAVLGVMLRELGPGDSGGNPGRICAGRGAEWAGGKGWPASRGYHRRR